MADPHAPAATPSRGSAATGPARERGWGGTLVALATFLLVPATPLLRTIVPIEQTWVLLLPALAACTLAGWRVGGRVGLALVWTALAAWVLSHPVTRDNVTSAYDQVARGWGLLLAGAFGIVFLLGKRRHFFPTALSGVALALALALGLAFASADPGRLRRTMVQELTSRNAPLLAVWDRYWASESGRQAIAAKPGMDEAVADARRQYQALPAIAATIAPAMLALESLAALALAWGLYHRMSRVRIGPPLAPLRQFRFNDQLIWGVIVGVTLLVLPTLDRWQGVGMNLTLFFGTLYALRGLGVLSFFVAPGWLATVILTVLAPFMWPFYAVGAIGLGLGDTWLDWRRRPRSSG
ncbi:MAG: DUF2232 domain-containing protein [Gemmatimonadaceae bacterium]